MKSMLLLIQIEIIYQPIYVLNLSNYLMHIKIDILMMCYLYVVYLSVRLLLPIVMAYLRRNIHLIDMLKLITLNYGHLNVVFRGCLLVGKSYEIILMVFYDSFLLTYV